MNRREQILTGNLWALILKLSVPGILGMLVISLNGLVDAFFVSHLLGADAFAGVSYTIPLLTLNAAVIALISSGAASVYSRAIGSGDTIILSKLFRHVSTVVVSAVLLLTITGLVGGNYFLSWFAIPAHQLKYARDFYQITILGSIFPVFGLCMSALLRAEGNVGKAMRITTVAMILNASLNPVLIYYAGLGVRGSAIASIASMAVYCVLVFAELLKGRSGIKIQWSGRIEIPFLKQILQTGLPTFYMQANGFFRQMILFKLAAYLSVDPSGLIVFSGIYRLFAFSAIPVFGMLQALGPVIGINFGAGILGRR